MKASDLRPGQPDEIDGYREINGGPIRKTNRFFVCLKSYGHCDEKGRTVMGVECSTKKIIAEPDRPMCLLAAVFDSLLQAFSYSSKEEAEADLAKFKKYVDSLKVGK